MGGWLAMSVETIETRKTNEARVPISKILGAHMTRNHMDRDALAGFRVVAAETSIEKIYRTEVRIPSAAESFAGLIVREAIQEAEDLNRGVHLAPADTDGIIDEGVIDLVAVAPVVEELAQALGVKPEYIHATE
jgi:hypothetical protein